MAEYPLLDAYIETKRNLWAETSLRSARSKLKTCLLISSDLDPKILIDTLKSRNFTLYTIKTYFILASKFESEVFHTDRIAEFQRMNPYIFRNAYQDRETIMTERDFEDILNRAPNYKIYNLVILLGKCGLRKSEALVAKWGDIHGNMIQVIGKGRKLRRVPIDPAWFQKVEGSSIVGGIQGDLKFFRKDISFTFQDFRAFYATRLVETPGISIKSAAKFLGHSNIQTTSRYLRVDEERAKDIVLAEMNKNVAL